jgi:hypothetical protein
MSCNRTFAVAIEDLLLEPNSVESQEFRRHCETCEECANELVAGEALLSKLRGEDPYDAQWHPADEDLLLLRSASASLAAPMRSRISGHLASCAPCHDAFEAFQQLVPVSVELEPEAAPAGALIERIADWVSGSLATLRPASLALAAVAVVGLVVLVAPPFGPQPEDELVVRGGRTIAPDPLAHQPMEALGDIRITLLASETMEASSNTFSEGDSLHLSLLLPDTTALPDRLFVSLQADDGRGQRGWHAINRGEFDTIDLEIDAQVMWPGRYDAEVFTSPNALEPLHVYTLIVR